MTGLERTIGFIKGTPVDRVPFHPIVMRWAAHYAGIPYGDFCRNHESKCRAMIQSAEDFSFDWVTTLSDPYAEAEAFGLTVEYPQNDLPLDRGGHCGSVDEVCELKPYIIEEHARLQNRVREIELYRNQCGNRHFIVGWVEGSVAEYGDLRGLSNASLDFYDDPTAVHQALDLINGAAMNFISAQIDAGAHCIGIGDAFCSQIGPQLYEEFAFEREKKLVDHIHSLGALAKLHICGNTTALIPDMIKTGADIIDIDHLVESMAPFAPLLGDGQVFCGSCDPVSVLQDGDAEAIRNSVAKCTDETGNRCIVSAGCEVTPGTTPEAMRCFQASAG